MDISKNNNNNTFYLFSQRIKEDVKNGNFANLPTIIAAVSIDSEYGSKSIEVIHVLNPVVVKAQVDSNRAARIW